MKLIGRIFDIPVYESKYVEYGKAYLMSGISDALEEELKKVIYGVTTKEAAKSKVAIVHPDDKDRFYAIVTDTLNKASS